MIDKTRGIAYLEDYRLQYESNYVWVSCHQQYHAYLFSVEYLDFFVRFPLVRILYVTGFYIFYVTFFTKN